MADEAPGKPHVDDELLRVAEVVHAGEVSVVFKPGPSVLARVGDALLDVAEASQVPMGPSSGYGSPTRASRSTSCSISAAC